MKNGKILIIKSLLLFSFSFISKINASSTEEGPILSSPQRHTPLSPRRNQTCGEHFINKNKLDAQDVLHILSLLELNPNFNSNEPNIILNDDVHCLKALFEYTPKNFTHKSLEVLGSNRQLINKGQFAFFTHFRPTDGTLGKDFLLTLTIIDKSVAPLYEKDNGYIKLLHRSQSLEAPLENIQELAASPSPKKKRSFSISRIRGALSPKSSFRKEKKKEVSPERTPLSSPIFNRNRANTTPKREKSEAEISKISPQTRKRALTRQLHKSKSYPEVREVYSKKDLPLKHTPLPPQSVKDRIKLYEDLSRKGK